jgi:hypothetical protein
MIQMHAAMAASTKGMTVARSAIVAAWRLKAGLKRWPQKVQPPESGGDIDRQREQLFRPEAASFAVASAVLDIGTLPPAAAALEALIP